MILPAIVLHGFLLSSALSAEPPRLELLKAGYLPVTANRNVVGKMHAAGLNAVWLKLTGFRPDGEDALSLRRIELWQQACSKAELQLWPVVNFAGGKNELDFFPDFRREVNVTGVVNPHTPCPTDEAYWRKIVFPRFLKVAELSKNNTALAGMVLDLEMYGADHAGYAVPCACEACRRGAGSDKPQSLGNWQRREVARICRELERQVHRIAPKFRFAAMNLDQPFPFYEGVALGLGTETLPVLCASERTYATGHTPEVEETLARLRGLSAHVAFVGGLSLTAVRAEQVAPQLYSLGSHGQGFWLYTLGSLALPAEQVEPIYRLTDSPSEYWSAFRLASDELDRWSASKGEHVSPLVARREPPPPRFTLTKRVLEPAFAEAPKLPLNGEEAHLRQYNICLVHLTANETLRLRVRGVQVVKQSQDGELKVVDGDGREVVSRPIVLGRSDDIEWTTESAGTFWITTKMGPHACQLTVTNPHLVHFAGRHQRLRAHRVIRPLYFLVGEGQSPAVDVVTEGASEAVAAKLLNPQGGIAAEKIVAGAAQLRADGPAGVWSITIQPAPGGKLEDVSLGLAPPLAPYLADAPERLLRDQR